MSHPTYGSDYVDMHESPTMTYNRPPEYYYYPSNPVLQQQQFYQQQHQQQHQQHQQQQGSYYYGQPGQPGQPELPSQPELPGQPELSEQPGQPGQPTTKIDTIMDLHNLPRMTPSALEEMLKAQNVVLGPDGTLMKKHIYRVKRYKGGSCGWWNRCCGGCYDAGRCCSGCNSNGCCDRKRIVYRRQSGGSEASIWSAQTAMKKGRC